MKFFLDTASLKDISWAAQAGLIDGVTTNPSLLAKQAGDLDPRDVLKEICSLVDGPVSAEVVGLETDGMVREGSGLAKIADNIVVKIPMTEAGMVAVRRPGDAGVVGRAAANRPVAAAVARAHGGRAGAGSRHPGSSARGAPHPFGRRRPGARRRAREAAASRRDGAHPPSRRAGAGG